VRTEKIFKLVFLRKQQRVQLCWATWLLERDDRVARVCGLQLAGRWSGDVKRSEQGVGRGKWSRGPGSESHCIVYA